MNYSTHALIIHIAILVNIILNVFTYSDVNSGIFYNNW